MFEGRIEYDFDAERKSAKALKVVEEYKKKRQEIRERENEELQQKLAEMEAAVAGDVLFR